MKDKNINVSKSIQENQIIKFIIKQHKKRKEISIKIFEELNIFVSIIKLIVFVSLLIVLIKFVLLKQKINKEKNKKTKVALCTMGRNEILYINEYVNYYLNLGVDTLFLYDDNIKEKEKFINAITPNDSIVIEYNQKLGFKDQKQSFTHCYNKHKNEYDWILMIDMDEYLMIKNNTLKGYLSNKVFDKCDTIKIHWKIPSDNNLVHYENKSLFERFKKETYKTSNHIKSILKGGINKLKYYQHAPTKSPERNKTCDNNGKLLSNKKLRSASLRPKNTDSAYFIHFYFKSTEEYIKKFRRGYKNWPHSGRGGWIFNYFKNNKVTLEKIELFEKAFNITLKKYRNKLKKKRNKKKKY